MSHCFFRLIFTGDVIKPLKPKVVQLNQSVNKTITIAYKKMGLRFKRLPLIFFRLKNSSKRAHGFSSRIS